MSSINWADPLWELAARFAINTVAMVLLMFGMYYRRYRDKELATTASMFNIFAFSVLTILSSVEFSIAAGFGLFAILALFSLRPHSSAPMTTRTHCFSSAILGRK
jgi:hypothetical protein